MRAHVGMAIAVCCGLGLPQVARASARSGDYSVQLLSETGRVLPTFQQDGRSYAMGTLGHRYSLRVRNGSAKRVELVASVDGRDVLDGLPSSWGKRGYLVNAHSEVVIDGFRLNREAVAAFRFSGVHSSYASRMGDARDVGVIGIAVFPERGETPMAETKKPFWNNVWGGAGQGSGEAGGGDKAEQPATGSQPTPADVRAASDTAAAPVAEREAAPAPAPTAAETPPAAMASSSAPGPNADLSLARMGRGGMAAVADGPAPAAMRARGSAHAAKKAAERPGLGTEFGEERRSQVGEVDFERGSARPAVVLGLHYDNREGLLAMGIDVDRRLELSREARLRQGAEPFRRSSPSYDRSPALLAR